MEQKKNQDQMIIVAEPQKQETPFIGLFFDRETFLSELERRAGLDLLQVAPDFPEYPEDTQYVLFSGIWLSIKNLVFPIPQDSPDVADEFIKIIEDKFQKDKPLVCVMYLYHFNSIASRWLYSIWRRLEKKNSEDWNVDGIWLHHLDCEEDGEVFAQNGNLPRLIQVNSQDPLFNYKPESKSISVEGLVQKAKEN